MHLIHISQITEKLHTAGEFSELMAMHDAELQILIQNDSCFAECARI